MRKLLASLATTLVLSCASQPKVSQKLTEFQSFESKRAFFVALDETMQSLVDDPSEHENYRGNWFSLGVVQKYVLGLVEKGVVLAELEDSHPQQTYFATSDFWNKFSIYLVKPGAEVGEHYVSVSADAHEVAERECRYRGLKAVGDETIQTEKCLVLADIVEKPEDLCRVYGVMLGREAISPGFSPYQKSHLWPYIRIAQHCVNLDDVKKHGEGWAEVLQGKPHAKQMHGLYQKISKSVDGYREYLEEYAGVID